MESEILNLLKSLRHVLKSAHWLTVGYENHLLFDRLMEGIDDEIDALSEVLFGITGEDFALKALPSLKEMISILSGYQDSNDPKILLPQILVIESEILNLIKPSSSLSIDNVLQGIAQHHAINKYLIERQLNALSK